MPKQRANALDSYLAKRNFAVTTEPASGGRSFNGRSFVIQKHWASKLHYDFRMELNGTMKSWALPKGPSLDPKDKRMAIAVEDHPIAYAAFEGTIPAKQYGAGKIIIWDRGTWEPVGNADAGLRSGNLKFRLHGEKLHGVWVLVRMKTQDEAREAWLLIKERDDAARATTEFSVVDELPDSVAVPREDHATSRAATGHGSAVSMLAPVTVSKKKRAPAVAKSPSGGVAAALPDFLAPQLATRVDRTPSDASEWQYEIKFDGYRILTRVEVGEVKLFTRNNNNWTSKLRHLAKAIASAKYPDGWYDGEIVVLNDKGMPDFGALQRAFDTPAASDIVLYLFDLPYCGGRDFRAVALERRRTLLQSIVARTPNDSLRFSETFDGALTDILTAACKLGLEGVMGKRRGSSYVSQRSTSWIKLKCGERQEFLVGGYTDPKGSRDAFGALLLGIHADDGSLTYVGKVGSGFTDASLKEISKKLKPLFRPSSPFARVPTECKASHWVKPEMLVEVSFSEWTKDQHLRAPVFRGIRIDGDAKLIGRESPVTSLLKRSAHEASSSKTSLFARSLNVTHGERIVDDSTGLTKLEMVRYYALVGSLMMPHLAQRPVSLVRAPDGFAGQLFFQKHMDKKLPQGLTALDPSLDPGHDPMVIVAGAEGLTASAQLNAVEFHTTNAVAKHMGRPDRLIFDLDPGAGVTWTQMQEATDLVHAFLAQLELVCFAKTSGGKGIHIVVPIVRRYEWTVAKDFAHAVVTHLARVLPTLLVATSGPKNRVGKIFIDYLRNGRGATTVSAWSARARPGAGVSVPVSWDEIRALKAADQWNVRNIHCRLDQGNSPWSEYETAANSLTRAIRTIGEGH